MEPNIKPYRVEVQKMGDRPFHGSYHDLDHASRAFDSLVFYGNSTFTIRLLEWIQIDSQWNLLKEWKGKDVPY